MKGAGTVSATSPRRNFTTSAANIRIVNSSSAKARLNNAALPGFQFLTSTIWGLPAAAEPAVPDSTRTSAPCATRSEIAAMIAAVVLGSGG